jgi:hypothetical protein
MSFKKTPITGLSRRTIALLALLGIGLGVILESLDAPLWVYYVAPISMAPILVPELRRHDAEGTSRREGDRR